jgi:hypothetical protein
MLQIFCVWLPQCSEQQDNQRVVRHPRILLEKFQHDAEDLMQDVREPYSRIMEDTSDPADRDRDCVLLGLDKRRVESQHARVCKEVIADLQ